MINCSPSIDYNKITKLFSPEQTYTIAAFTQIEAMALVTISLGRRHKT